MAHTKIAISIDEEIFRKMENLSHRSNISRSRLFEQAATIFLMKKNEPDILKQLNKVYSSGPSKDDKEWLESVAKQQRQLLEREENKW